MVENHAILKVVKILQVVLDSKCILRKQISTFFFLSLATWTNLPGQNRK